MIQQGSVINETYRIDGKIGAGGGGTVFKAYHLRLEKPVVVKRINDNWVNIIDSRKEADIIKNLKHQYLPQAYDFLKLEDGIYTVMDYVSGASLDKYIKSGVKFTQQQILFWTKQATEALVYLHSQTPPIIHSDIKPANIMVNAEGNVCLIDFNVSLTSTPDSSISATSRGYAAPEQYLNVTPLNEPEPGKPFQPKYHFDMKTPLDQRSDIYSLGATLYHMMTGNRPPRLPEEKLPRIPDDLAGFDETLIHIVNKMTEYDPRDRYQTAEALLHDLQNIRKLDKRYVRQRRVRWIANVLFTMLMVGGILLGVGGYLKMKQEDDDAFLQSVSQADRLVEKKEYDEAEKLYREAIDKKNDDITAYLGILNIYSKQYRYEEAVTFAKDALAAHSFEGGQNTSKERADFYYLLANAYFEQEDYENSLTYYQKAVELNQENPEYFRDFAIALARSKYVDKAKETLQKATELKLDNTAINFVKAEIAMAEGNDAAAEEAFMKVFEDAPKDSDLYQRSCLSICTCYKNQKKYQEIKEFLRANEGNLNEARYKVARLMQGEAYLALAREATGDEQIDYGKKAVEMYLSVKAQGVQSKSTKFNLVTAYLYAEDIENAQRVLNGMKADYPEDCDVYARLAILEVYKQDKRTAKDYGQFKELYDKAKELSKRSGADGTTSLYMTQMEEYMQEIRDKNWL